MRKTRMRSIAGIAHDRGKGVIVVVNREGCDRSLKNDREEDDL